MRPGSARARSAAAECVFERQRIGGLQRNELRDPVDVTVAHAEHATRVAQHGLCRHRAVGDDLADLVAPVLARDVVDHRIAAVHAEVDVEVGHRHAFGIEEALEQQAVAQRIEIGDAEAPGDHRAGAGAASGTDRNIVALGPVDEVGDDEEVAGEAHLHDHVEFAVQARGVIVVRETRRRSACFGQARLAGRHAPELRMYESTVSPAGSGNSGR